VCVCVYARAVRVGNSLKPMETVWWGGRGVGGGGGVCDDKIYGEIDLDTSTVANFISLPDPVATDWVSHGHGGLISETATKIEVI